MTGNEISVALTINGEARDGDLDPIRVINPATEETVACAPAASEALLDEAVAGARKAFAAWRRTPVSERKDMVRALGDALEARAEEFARLLTTEQGKPLAAARAEIGRAVEWARTLPEIDIEERVAIDDDMHTVRIRHVPLGVVAGIVPWNFPVTLAMWKIVPALLTGNTIVLKPSPFTPLTGLALGELARKILPAGVLNVVTGPDSLGPALTAHPGIDKIAFTGSTQTGKAVMAAASGTLKRVTLELGGNDAAIVLPDANVQALAPQLFWACFANSSQYCLATKRLYVHESIREELLAAMAEYADTVVIGNGLDESVQMGPIQNRMQYEKVLAFIEESEQDGHSIVYRGRNHPDTGYFVGPVIVDRPPEDSRLVQEEPFGPIVPVLSFTDEDDLIRRVNASRYGLGGSVWGTDVDRAVRIAEQIESGQVWVNEIHKMSPLVPLAGHRESGIGRENAVEGILEYCNTQAIAVNRG